MKNQIKALKVKIKSLAEEARIIRREERRSLGRRKCPTAVHPDYHVFLYRDDELYLSLRGHRITDVRSESRSAMLAYGFLRGRPYATLERCRRGNHPSISRVIQLVTKFGSVPGGASKYTPADVTAWFAVVPTPAPTV